MAPAPRRTDRMIALRMVPSWIVAYMVIGWWFLVVTRGLSVGKRSLLKQGLDLLW